ncbi:plasmid mobilization relaxosome protein MobC [Paenarthrobacter histidinolovorans]|uniref:Bacterial mobilisation domain-containing protein n=1 Tax=Paenarthrobacter histidinolovorans TaxID=43664 RepID=A0ABW8MZG0_9MICC
MSESPRARRLGKARRENVAGGRLRRIEIGVTDREKAALAVRAVQQNVTVPRLLVESALSDRGETPIDRRNLAVELLGIRTLLGAVSNNINQIARHANANSEFPDDAEAAVAAARRLMLRIDEAVRVVMRP